MFLFVIYKKKITQKTNKNSIRFAVLFFLLLNKKKSHFDKSFKVGSR